jgi:hypothetical protein
MLSLTSIASSSFIIIYISAVHGLIFQRYIITFFKWISWRQNAIHQLKYLADQLPTPFIIMGDFHTHSPLWGTKSTNDKGKNLKDFISQEGLCILIDNTDAYLHPGNGYYSVIDLTVTDPLKFFSAHLLVQRPASFVTFIPRRCFTNSRFKLSRIMRKSKLTSQIAKRPNDSSENILHRTISAISASSGRKLEEQNRHTSWSCHHALTHQYRLNSIQVLPI